MKAKNPVGIMLLVLAVVVFIASVIVSFKFFQFDYPVTENVKSTHSIDIPLENLVPGNTTANIAQFVIPEERADIRQNFGSFCEYGNSIFYYKKQKKKQYIMRNDLSSPDGGAPIVEGYDASYFCIYNGNLYFIGTKEKQKSKIYTCGLNGGAVEPIKEDTEDVISLVSNSNFLYYTTKNRNSIFYLSYDGKKDGVLLNLTGNCSNIRLIGTKAQFLYYVCESGAYEVNLLDMSSRLLSHQCSSLYQYPMITDKGLMYFSDLSSHSYMLAPFTGGEPVKVFDSSIFDNNVRTLSYDSGYLFVLSDDSVYYTSLGEGNASQIKGVTVTENGTFRIADGYCVYNDGDKISSVGINWILAS